MRTITPALVLAVAVVLGGCGSGTPDEDGVWAGAVDTLASGVVVVENSSVGMWSNDEQWSLEEDFRIGAVEGEGPNVFGRIVDLEVDGEGRIYVLDGQASELRLFGPEGRHVRTLGGPGEGPGEFGNAFGIKVSPTGSLWVMDPGNGRYSVFDTAGSLVATLRRPIGFFRMDGPAGFDRDGFFYDYAMRHAEDARESREVLVRINRAAELVDTVPLPHYSPEAITIARADGTPYMRFPKPFSPTLVWRFDPRGYIWFAVGDRYEMVQRDLDGDTVRIVRQNYTPVPVSAEERDSALDVIQDRITSVGAGARVEGEPEVAEVKPPFETLHVDTEGFVWVERSRARGQSSRFDIFDSDGRYLGAVEPPVEVQAYPAPVITDEAMYAVVTDSLDIAYVVRLRIVGRS